MSMSPSLRFRIFSTVRSVALIHSSFSSWRALSISALSSTTPSLLALSSVYFLFTTIIVFLCCLIFFRYSLIFSWSLMSFLKLCFSGLLSNQVFLFYPRDVFCFFLIFIFSVQRPSFGVGNSRRWEHGLSPVHGSHSPPRAPLCPTAQSWTRTRCRY